MAKLKTALSAWAKPAPLLLAALLALWGYLGRAVMRTGSCTGYLHDPARILLSIAVTAVAWLVLSILVSLAFALLDRLSQGSAKSGGVPSGALSLAVLVILLACWLPYLIACFPGLINFDYFNQLNQFVGARPLSNHHPVAMTFLLGTLYELGHLVGGASGGLYLTVWAQALALAGLFSYAHRWLCRMGVRRGVRIAFVAFCALCPLFPLYACVLVKDTFSAVVLGLFALQVAVRSWSERAAQPLPRMATLPALALVGVAASLTRANCVYLVVGTLLVCLLALKRTSKVRLLVTICLIGASYLGWTNALLPAMGVIPTDAALVISIPLQQTGAYARYAPQDATDEERAAIEGIMTVSYDQVGQLYTPNIVDPLQSVTRADDRERLAAYLGAWASQGVRHPGIYLDALLRANIGYWYPGIPFDQLQDLDYLNNTPASHLSWMQGLGYGFTGDLSDMDTAISPFEGARTSLRQAFVALSGLPVAGFLLQPAFYTWTCLLLGIWSAVRRRPAAPLLALVVLLFLVECVSPLAASLRYALPLVVLTPLLWGTSLAPLQSRGKPRHARS